jgi:nucleotide-binding universal stress UspA family protein
VIGPVDRLLAWSAPRVVVGVDPTSSGAAVGFAFHAACQRGIPLIALSAFTPGAAGDITTIPGAPPASEAAAGRALEQALARWRAGFPTVPVIAKLVCADAAQALIAESPGAALLVVGSRRRVHLRGLRSGSVSQDVLRHAGCPVAVVGRDRTAAGRTTAARTGAQRGPVWEPRSTDRTRRQPFWIRRASR